MMLPKKVVKYKTNILSFIYGSISYLVISFIVNNLPEANFVEYHKNFNELLWQISIILSLFILPSILNNIVIYKGIIKSPIDLPIGIRFLYMILGSISIILTILFFVLSRIGDFTLIGLLEQSATELIYNLAFFLFIFAIISIGSAISKKSHQVGYRDIVQLWIKEVSDSNTNIQRIIALIFIFFSIISEELLYRGYVVLYLGYHYGELILFGIISIVLSVISHLYQGKERILYHTLFAVIMVIITIETKNILLTIALHFFLSSLSVLNYWKNSDQDHSNNN